MPLGPYGYITAPYTLDTASFSNEWVNLSSGGLDCMQWFHPTACGTVTHLELLLFKTGTPDEKAVDIEIWRCGSEASYSTTPYSGNSWTKLAGSQIFPSSIQDIAINSPCNARWLRLAVDSPFWIDDRGGSWLDAASMDGMNLARSVLHGYAIKLFRTAANSDGGANGFVRLPHAATQNWNSIFGGRTSAGSSNLTRGGTAAGVPDFPVRVLGYRQINSQYLDTPVNVWTQSGYSHRFSVTSHVANVDVSSGIFQKRGAPFMAVGSKITRVMFPLLLDGASSGDHSNYASIWTFDQNSGIPGTCLGSTSIVRWGLNGLPSTDMNDRETAWMFVFSGGIDVTSGNIYVAALESAANSAAATRLTKWPSYATDVQSARRFFWDSRSPDLSGPGNAWGIASGFQHMFEAWYVDSATNAGLVDVSSTPPTGVFSNQNYIYTNSHSSADLMGVTSQAWDFFRHGRNFGFAYNGAIGAANNAGVQWFFPTECGTVTHLDLFLYNALHNTKGMRVEAFADTNSANMFHIPNASSGWQLLGTIDIDPGSLGQGWYGRQWTRFAWDTPFFLKNGPVGQNDTVTTSGTAFYSTRYALKFSLTSANSWNNGAKFIRTVGENDGAGNVQGDFTMGFGAFTTNTFYYGSPWREDILFRLVGSVQPNSNWLDRPMHTVQRSTPWPCKVGSHLNTIVCVGASDAQRLAQKFWAVGSVITRILLSGWADGSTEDRFYIAIYSHDVTSDQPGLCLHSGDFFVKTTGGNLWTGDLDDTEMVYGMTYNGTSGIALNSGQPYWYVFEAASGMARGGANLERGANRQITFGEYWGATGRWQSGCSYLDNNSLWQEVASQTFMPALIYYRDSDTVNGFPGAGGGGSSTAAPFRREFPNTRRRIDPVDVYEREFPLD